ncbi:UNVERIFIED_CONTAM: hypothetical protein GTU68_029384 [Idotea baltica]|nr:hypothetical protein [Idotea baltica]
MRAPGIGEKSVALVKNAKSLARAEQEVKYCEKRGVEILNYLDDDYPNDLKYIHDAPLILFKRGAVNLNVQPNIAIVGTRKATEYGKELTEQFAAYFAERGLNVVSGLAYGVDIQAHKTVVKMGGITTGVLGHGLDMIYPGRHYEKAQQMIERGGLLTEYLTETKPEAAHFPARNRIISGICKGVIVIEAAEKGGALITAKYAFDQNREVFAVPGRVGDTYSKGCNNLISRNIAKLTTDPQEVLEELDIQWQQHSDRTDQLKLALSSPPKEPLSPDEAKVLNFLAKGEAVLDDITHHTGIPIHRINALLLSMEFKELLRQMPGKKFKRV